MSRSSCLLIALMLPLAAAASPETYTLDPSHTIPNFSIGHLGMSTVHGHFERASGKVVLDRAAKTGTIEVKIPTVTVSTGDSKRTDGSRSRDEHLRTTDFFNVAEFPDMVFKSTKVNFSGDKIQSVDGTLTLLGVSKPVTLNASSFNCGTNPMSKKDMCGGDLVGSIKRTDFGMKFAVPAISDEVKLVIAVEGYKE
jgi:polyisoprenoid-binding protein YceI